MEFTEQEYKAIAQIVRAYAKDHGEDISGAILYSGAFHLINKESGVVTLAKKIEAISDSKAFDEFKPQESRDAVARLILAVKDWKEMVQMGAKLSRIASCEQELFRAYDELGAQPKFAWGGR